MTGAAGGGGLRGERMKLDAQSWARVETLFHKISALREEERGAFLDRECKGDLAVRAELESLVATSTGVLQRKIAALGRASENLVHDSSTAMAGREIAGYTIVRELGRGGSGIVFLAQDHRLAPPRPAAIKVLPGAVFSETAMKRFGNEREILSSLRHPHIARFFDSGSTPEGIPYVIMEYVDGTRLDEYCTEQRFDLVGRISIMLRVCAAVEYAHQNRVVHRDLKPGNILVLNSGAPKLLDFGIAKLVRSDQKLTGATTATHIMTPRYASPEQLRGERVGVPSDVYALGLILYKLATGALPYGEKGNTPSELEKLIATTNPVPPSVAAKDSHMAGEFDRILLKALHRNSSDRYQSAASFAEDLHQYLVSG